MPSYALHLSCTADAWAARDTTVIVTLDAADDAKAQELVAELLPDLEYDVVEIECAECSMPVYDCNCQEAA